MSNLTDSKKTWWAPLFVLIALLALCCSVLGFRFMLADIKSEQAQLFLDDWSSRSAVGSDKAWDVARAAAEDSIRLSPVAYGPYFARLGLVHEWKQFQSSFIDQTARASREEALSAYRSALDVRPLWPYYWSKIASIKLRLLELDEELGQALDRGYALGPGRINVIGSLSKTSLLVWPQLDPEQKARFWRGLELLFEYDPRRAGELMDLVSFAGIEQEMCQTINFDLLQRRGQCKSE